MGIGENSARRKHYQLVREKIEELVLIPGIQELNSASFPWDMLDWPVLSGGIEHPENLVPLSGRWASFISSYLPKLLNSKPCMGSKIHTTCVESPGGGVFVRVLFCFLKLHFRIKSNTLLLHMNLTETLQVAHIPQVCNVHATLKTHRSTLTVMLRESWQASWALVVLDCQQTCDLSRHCEQNGKIPLGKVWDPVHPS